MGYLECQTALINDMTADLKHIESLLAEKKYDQVRAVIEASATEKLSAEEEGAALTDLASAYLDISNAINERYRSALEEAIAGMKEINAAEERVNERVKLEEVRHKLNAGGD